MSVREPVRKKPMGPDWERIEADYRAGVLSLREVAARGGVTDGAVRKRAKKLGWSRDLTAPIRARADELIRSAVRTDGTQSRTSHSISNHLISNADELVPNEAVRADGTQGTQLNTGSTYADKAIVEANAQAIAAVRLAHRIYMEIGRASCRERV